MTVQAWEKLPALDGRSNPCLCCPPILSRAPMHKTIAVGFGDAHASRDREEVYREPSAYHGTKRCTVCNHRGHTGDAGPEPRVLKRRSAKNEAEWAAYYKRVQGLPLCGTCGGLGTVEDPDAAPVEYWDFAEVEKLAAADPDHDWRVTLFGPLHGEVYQRHGPDEWNLVENNQGFA